MRSVKMMTGLLLTGLITLVADFGYAATYSGNVTIRPMSPTASWTCTLQPKDSATFSVTVINQESGYRLKSGPTAEITGQDILWTGGPTTFNVVNEAPEVASTQAKVTCVWEPYGGGPGTGPRPPDINGLATGTAQLKVAHIEWGTMSPLVQAADGTSTIAWEVKLVNDSGDLVSGISVTFTLSAGNGAWQLSPSSGPGPRLLGTVVSTEGSRGSLQVNYTYFGKAKSSTSSSITFVEIEKVQHRIGTGAWADTPEPVVVASGTTVEFKAIPNPSDASWPSGKPVWTGASGSGDQASQTFDTPGTNTVSAECGNTQTRHVVVFKVELTGATSTTRGNSETYTATVTPDGLNPTFAWKFTGGGTTVQKNTGTTKTWSGVMVAGGTLEVTATIGSTEPKDTLNVAVNARNWNADVQSPNMDRTWGDPPTEPGNLGEAQAIGVLADDINVVVTKITDEGPNNSFTYVTAQPVQHGMIIRINKYLNNSGSTFSLAQGNADDVQVIPSGQGKANSTIITAGTNGVINTTPSGDDAIVGATITSGSDGIANTAKDGDDVQVIAVGKGQANTTIIHAGSSGGLNIAANPSGDDVTVGTNIIAGTDGIANTAIDNRSEVAQSTLLTAVEKHEGTSGNKNETSHWTYWYEIESNDTDMNEEAEDEIGVGTADELKTSVVDKLEPIRVRLFNAWLESPEPPAYLSEGTEIDFKYPDPSWPAY